MKKLLYLKSIIKLTVLFSILLIPIRINAQAHVYVSPQTSVLSGQGTVTVDFMISNVDSLQSYYISVLFNNSVIAFQSAAKGLFLSIGGSTYFDKGPNPVIDSVQVTEVLFGPNHPPVSGSGKLFSITFNVLAAGSSTIHIDNVYLSHQRGNVSIPVTWTSGEVVVPAAVNAKVFLQGPFNTNIMSTTLNSSGFIPPTQPYSGTPWNYNGTESVSSGFFSTHPNIVDWILVELRTDTNPNSIVETRAGFITNTGVIVNLNGISPLYFIEAKGNYYIVIYHRNHLPIMSLNSVNLDYVSSQYDFTNSQSKAYGTNAMVDLGGGIFGMFAADANGNGQVQNNDSENYWVPQNGQSGYREADFNLNGQVQNNDHESYWVPNNGKGAQVPN
jgi:hypothetical protein